MLVQVKELLYWKTEHGNTSNCQDVLSYDPAQGLFAVADGASTSLFPALWARVLAQHFQTTPLMSDDPFEVEWWVRIAQTEYKRRMPHITATVWNIQQKMRNQCSDATLATLRITKVDTATAQAMLLVFGDSCVLIGNPEKQTVSSFILQRPSEFDRAPICVPSDLKYFNRDFHRCQTRPITLHAGDQVIMVTDAVARWILERGEMAAVWEAFQEVYQCPTLDNWYTLVEAKRQCGEMIDDDSTALVLTFSDDSPGSGTPLGCTNSHTEEVVSQRKKALEEAVEGDNKELIAIAYGDGNDLPSITAIPPLNTIDIAHAREVAHALKEVLGTFRQAQNSPNLVQKVRPVWEQYSHLLQGESCAANLCETLRNNGIIRATQGSQPTSAPQQTSVDPPRISTSSNISTSAPRPAIPTAASGQGEHYPDITTQQTISIPFPESANFHQLPDNISIAVPGPATPTTSKGSSEPRFHTVEESTISTPLAKPVTPPTVFTEVMQQPHIYLQELLNAYYKATRIEPELTLPPRDKEMVMLAGNFKDAWRANDPYAIAKAYRNINRSHFSSQIVFTSEEVERCVQADSFVRGQKEEMKKTIIARVDDYVIPLENYVGTYIIKHMYIRYLASQPPSSQAEAIEQARASNMHQNDFLLLVLEELIDNILINSGFLALTLPQEDPVHRELDTTMAQIADELKDYEESLPDPQFRRHELGKKDLYVFTRMLIIRKVFAAYLDNQKRLTLRQKKLTLDKWLKEKREEMKDKILFNGRERYASVNRIQILSQLKQYIKTYIY